MNDTLARILIVALIVPIVAVSAYIRSRAARNGGDKIDRTQEGVSLMFVLRIGGLGVWLTTLVYLINPNWIQFAQLPFPDTLRWFGFALSLVAVPLLIWMLRSLGNNITDTVQTRQNAELVVRGPYRWVRHPLYSFGALFFIGVILMSASGLLALFSVITFAVLMLRTPNEEAHLVEKFGDGYREYMTRTARFIPGIV